MFNEHDEMLNERAFGMSEMDYVDSMDFGRDEDEELDDMMDEIVDEDERYFGDDEEEFDVDDEFSRYEDGADYVPSEDHMYGGFDEFQTPEFDE